jgi:hypothetical protein
MSEDGARAPASRTEGLIIERLPGELLVYDQERDEAHCLHAEAAAVFDLLDGARTGAEIAALASEHLPEPVSEATVERILTELSARNLLAGDDAAADGLSRRDVIQRGTLVGAGAVLITSIAAPIPAAAQSPGNTGGCTTGTTCEDEQGVPCPENQSENCLCVESTEGSIQCIEQVLTTLCMSDTDCEIPAAAGPDCVSGISGDENISACVTECTSSNDCATNEICVEDQSCLSSGFCAPLCGSTNGTLSRSSSGARRGRFGLRLLRG